jgi:hypothetical protein
MAGTAKRALTSGDGKSSTIHSTYYHSPNISLSRKGKASS